MRHRCWLRAIVFLVMTALGSSIWATCVAAAASTQADDMACCKAGHLACDTQGNSDNCCNHSAQSTQTFTAAKIAPGGEPAAFVAVGSIAVSGVSRPRLAGIPVTFSPPGSRPPNYVLFSTLRL